MSSTSHGTATCIHTLLFGVLQAQPEKPRLRVVCLLARLRIMLFMKGNKNFPQCGFSNTAVQILNAMNVPYETYDVLSDQSVRDGIKEFSNWPTIPQCYIEGEFIGGCDLMHFAKATSAAAPSAAANVYPSSPGCGSADSKSAG